MNWKEKRNLTISFERKRVVSFPNGILRLMVVTISFGDTTVLLSSSSKPSRFSSLVNGITDPVDFRVPSDSFMEWVNKDDLEILVNPILVDPVRVENSETSTSSRNSLFCNRL